MYNDDDYNEVKSIHGEDYANKWIDYYYNSNKSPKALEFLYLNWKLPIWWKSKVKPL